jgi:hypothetical protein
MAGAENALLVFAKSWVFDGERNVLPEEVLAFVFEFLVDNQSICSIQLVCRATKCWKRRAIHRRRLDWVYRNVKIVLGSAKAYQLRNASLTTMSFYVDYICDAGATVMGEALKVNTSLTELTLSRNNIGETGAKAIGSALKVNPSLTYVDLSHNQVGDDGGKSIVEALKINTSLLEINLSWNNIGDEGAKSIGEALKVSAPCFTHINLSHNNIGDEGAKAMQEAIIANSSLTQINLSSNNISLEGREALRVAREIPGGCTIEY